MKSRRDFLKKTLLGGVLAAVGGWNVPGVSALKTMAPEAAPDWQWCRTIFCQFDNQALKNAIEACARQISCRAIFGEAGSPDVYAVPAFVQIIDRTTFDPKDWNAYVAFSDDTYEDEPCILVDSALDLAMPKTRFVGRCCMPWLEEDMKAIVGLIRYARQTAYRRNSYSAACRKMLYE